MATTYKTYRFRWTAQCERAALLLAAMGYSDKKIADCLNCSQSTINRRLRPKTERRVLSPADVLDLFEQYDAQRNIEEVITAMSGTIEQARLRTSHRVRKPKSGTRVSEPSAPMNEELSHEQLRRKVEALVGRKIRVRGDA